MTILELTKRKVLGILGLAQTDKAPDVERLTFINDDERITRTKLHEYTIWYMGDSDELLNFYTYHNTIEYAYEPFYDRNKKNYFWAKSSTEAQIKRTHSGLPRDITDTIVSICPFPLYNVADKSADERLRNILNDCGMEEIYRTEQFPLTLVHGWGCYKINWDRDISDYPFPIYYRAENVDFIYKAGRITGCIFRDYYYNDKTRYMLVETRHTESVEYEGVGKCRALVIDKELFRMSAGSDDYIEKVELSEVPELKDIQTHIEIGPYSGLLAVPCILLPNTGKNAGYGRSIYTGRIDLFDDLDQCLSQSSNTVRLSTPIEYINAEYLERTKDGRPKRPVAFDRKYVMIDGGKDADGTSQGDPLQISQPNLNITQYTETATAIVLQVISGMLSPATMGIDIAKKDNAEAQREKEKVTIFFRNMLLKAEEIVLKRLFSELLCAEEFMKTGKITVHRYDVSVKFNEFADESFENKLKILGNAYGEMLISDEMYMNKLYGDTLDRASYDKELKWLQENHSQPRKDGMLGMAGDGGNFGREFPESDENEMY